MWNHYSEFKLKKIILLFRLRCLKINLYIKLIFIKLRLLCLQNSKIIRNVKF